MKKFTIVLAVMLGLSFFANESQACWFRRARCQRSCVQYCQKTVPCRTGNWGKGTCKGGSCEGGSCKIGEEFTPGIDSNKTNSVFYLNAVNTARARFGLKALKLDATLVKECEEVVDDNAQRGCLCHLMRGIGVSEIIAYNYSGFNEAVNQWTVSSGHAAHLYNAGYNRVGVALKKVGNRNYCCVKFGY